MTYDAYYMMGMALFNNAKSTDEQIIEYLLKINTAKADSGIPGRGELKIYGYVRNKGYVGRRNENKFEYEEMNEDSDMYLTYAILLMERLIRKDKDFLVKNPRVTYEFLQVHRYMRDSIVSHAKIQRCIGEYDNMHNLCREAIKNIIENDLSVLDTEVTRMHDIRKMISSIKDDLLFYTSEVSYSNGKFHDFKDELDENNKNVKLFGNMFDRLSTYDNDKLQKRIQRLNMARDNIRSNLLHIFEKIHEEFERRQKYKEFLHEYDKNANSGIKDAEIVAAKTVYGKDLTKQEMTDLFNQKFNFFKI